VGFLDECEGVGDGAAAEGGIVVEKVVESVEFEADLCVALGFGLEFLPDGLEDGIGHSLPDVGEISGAEVEAGMFVRRLEDGLVRGAGERGEEEQEEGHASNIVESVALSGDNTGVRRRVNAEVENVRKIHLWPPMNADKTTV
jgi:hypothetical protein